MERRADSLRNEAGQLLAGVYAITCLPTGKQYIGSAAQSFQRRCQQHRWALGHGVHKCRHLQNAWNKYGEAVFRFDIVEICAPEDCLPREQYWVDVLQPAFNSRRIVSSNLGLVHPPEFGRKISASALARSRDCWYRGEEHPNAGMSDAEALEILRLYADGIRQAEIVRRTGLRRPVVHNIVKGKKWKHLHSGVAPKGPDGKGLVGEGNTSAKLNEAMVVALFGRIADGERLTTVAQEWSVSTPTLARIIHGRGWKHVAIDPEIRQRALRTVEYWRTHPAGKTPPPP